MTGLRIFGPDDAELGPATDLSVARSRLAGWAAPSPAQEAVRDRIVAFIDAHADAAERSCRPGHLTGSALVVDDTAERTLLLHHTKLRRWLQPGGHADGDTDLAHVAWREATEETGIEGLRVIVPAVDLDVHRVEPPGEPAHDHLDVRFVVLAPPGAVAEGNHESRALRWVTEPELVALGVDEGLRRLAHVGLALARSQRR